MKCVNNVLAPDVSDASAVAFYIGLMGVRVHAQRRVKLPTRIKQVWRIIL